MTRVIVAMLAVAAACATAAPPRFDPADPASWGPPRLLVTNTSLETVAVYGPYALLGRLQPGEKRCFTIHGAHTGSIWFTAELNTYARVRTLDVPITTSPGWRWDITTSYASDVFVVPAWPCNEEPQ